MSSSWKPLKEIIKIQFGRKMFYDILPELPWEWEYPWGFPFPWDGNGNGKDFFPVGIPIGIPIGIPMGIPIGIPMGIPMGYSNTVSLGHP